MSPRELPEGFTAMLRESLPGDVAATLTAALSNTEPSVSVRSNALRGVSPAEGFKRVPWLGTGIYLDERPAFAADPAWHQGLYYVQDASSMIMTEAVSEIVRQRGDGAPLRFLDACAAPGGKTISATEALPDGSAILANEYDRKRAGALTENLGKYGYPDIAVCNGNAAKLGKLGPVFDIIAVDAPCSGEGMMRKEPEAIRQWSRGLVESCAALQREILAGVWDALKPGGVIIYSTGTFNPDENEKNVRFIAEELGADSVDLRLDRFEGVCRGFGTTYHCYHLFPGLVRGEGLFIAALRKHEGGFSEPKIKVPSPVKDKNAADFVSKALLNPEKYTLLADGDAFSVCSADQAAFLAYLASRLKLMRCGLPVCRLKGKDALPAWETAFSTAFNPGAFDSIPLDYAGAMSYLHGDSLTDIPEACARGIVTATYDDTPLGFAKNIGRRANNLYPDFLRLRMNPSSAAPQQPLISKPL